MDGAIRKAKSSSTGDKMPDTAIFLGAGASVAEGAPSQASLFRDYFAEKRRRNEPVDEQLADYFQRFWRIDLGRGDLESTVFPTFEEALGMLEMARDRGEGFRGFYGTAGSNQIGQTIENLVFLIAEILHRRLQRPGDHHQRLVDSLVGGRQIRDVAFVSLNYDILADNALAEAYQHVDLDYGVEFANFAESGWTRPREGRSTLLLKIHGSLNWLYCPVCKGLWITPKTKGVIKLISRRSRQAKRCEGCGGSYVPILIPPTFFKVMSNPYLVAVWEKAEQLIRSCRRIVFCGYSLPDADMHIKYLLKRGQMNRRGPRLKVFVVNNHDGKPDSMKSEELDRYVRLFGKSAVVDAEMSFEEFARDPMDLVS